MHKQAFLANIQEKLAGLPQEDIEKSLEYYSEMIDDRMEDGLSEADAVAAMGSPEEIAAQILSDFPFPKLVKAKVQPSRTLRAWEIVLLVLGSPLWLTLLLALLAVAFSIYVSLWAVVISLFAVNVSVAACALAGIVAAAGFAVAGKLPQALLFGGAGFVCTGVAILLFLLFGRIAAWIAVLSKRFVLWLKSHFIRKER